MIILSWGVTPEDRKHPDGTPYPYAAFRWALEGHLTRDWWALEIVAQKQHREDNPSWGLKAGEWSTNHTPNYGIGFDWRKFHRPHVDHVYYDGPHCSFSIGWFRLLWSGFPWTNHWCEKCMPRD